MLKVTKIVFMDDAEMSIDQDITITYKPAEQFIQVFYKGNLSELINTQCVRSMDIAPPSRKCKWCQQDTSTTPCSNCLR